MTEEQAVSRTAVAKPAIREPWIDIAKGIAIVLVVLYHSSLYLSEAGVVGLLAELNPLLDTFRMPLFFFMSGILGARVVTLGYRQLFRKRLLLLLYLYVVWVIAQQLFLRLMPPIRTDGDRGSWAGIANFLIFPNENLWFIYALPLFFTFAWLTRSLPRIIPGTFAVLLSIAFGTGLLHTATPWDKMGRYLVFFLFALWIGGWVRSLAPHVRWWHPVVALAIYAVLVVAMLRFDLIRVPGVLLVVSCVAVAVGITAAVVLSRVPAFDVVRYLGTRTLPIYLVHTFPMIAVAGVLATGVVVPGWIATVLPLVLAAAAILIALGVYRLLRGVPGIFTLPVASWAL
ncbi:MAG: acyltransferase family protein [Leifsonia sp.]